MAKTQRSTYAKESDRIRKLIKRFTKKSGFSNDAYEKLRDAIHAGSIEDFYERASKLHSVQDIQSAWAHLAEDLGFVKFEQIQDDNFETALAIIGATRSAPDTKGEEPLGLPYSEEPYHSPNTDAQNRIASWWSNVVKNFVAPLRHWEKLPDEVFVELKTWKEETIKLIGEENFADLIENQMSYKTEKKYGNVDYVDYFTCLYDDEQHRYETMGEVASRISFWLRIASDKALEYIPEDEDAGDYDEIIGDLLNRLENYW